MAADHNLDAQNAAKDEVEGGDEYLDPNDVLIEAPGDEDAYMEDPDDDEGGDRHGAEEDQQGSQEGDDEIVFEDNSIQQFPTHQKSVFAVAVHPTLPIAASGGEDDMGYLWNINDGQQIARLSGHTDSVCSTAFSADGTMVATGGMDGKVRVWRKIASDDSGKQWEFLTEIVGPDEVMWLRWHPKGNALLAGANDSTLWLWQLPSGKTMQVFAGHNASVQAGDFTPDGKRIATGDGNGSLILWDPRSPAPLWKLTGADGRFSLKGGITALAINPSSSLVVVGGSAGGIRVVNLAKGTVVGALEGHEPRESIEAIEFLEFGAGASIGQGSGIMATGGTDGKICIWDLAVMKLRSTLQHDDAVTTLISHPQPNGHLLTSGSVDKTLKTWDARAGKLLQEHLGHQGPVFKAALTIDGGVVVSASDDGVCLVFNTT